MLAIEPMIHDLTLFEKITSPFPAAMSLAKWMGESTQITVSQFRWLPFKIK